MQRRRVLGLSDPATVLHCLPDGFQVDVSVREACEIFGASATPSNKEGISSYHCRNYTRSWFDFWR